MFCLHYIIVLQAGLGSRQNMKLLFNVSQTFQIKLKSKKLPAWSVFRINARKSWKTGADFLELDKNWRRRQSSELYWTTWIWFKYLQFAGKTVSYLTIKFVLSVSLLTITNSQNILHKSKYKPKHKNAKKFISKGKSFWRSSKITKSDFARFDMLTKVHILLHFYYL